MSATLTPIITSNGLNAVFNAHHNGLDATITEIALGDLGWMPDNTATALQNEKRRIPVSGERVNAAQIHLTGVEDGDSLEYWVRELGFYLADGTLLAIWSDPNQALAYKSASVDLLLAFDLVLSALPANSVTIDGSAGFSLPPATNNKRGMIRIATQAEVELGMATDLAVNPAQLAAATQDGQGSGLDADLVRGLPAEFSSDFSAFGYQKLPSGLIIQWGKGHTEPIAGTDNRAQVIVKFPITFPNTALTAVANSTPNIDQRTHPRVLSATNLNNINMRVISTAYEYGVAISPISFSYIAIGF